MNILVFKTNLTDPKHISAIGSGLDIHPGIIEWNVDLQDCDNILRIVSSGMEPSVVESILQDAGYYCKELL